MLAAALAQGRQGLYPSEANHVRKVSRILVEDRSAAAFAEKIAALGRAPGAEPWPWP